MEGMSERAYAARVGLSRGAVQKAKAAQRLVLHADGSIDAAASDRRRAESTDPAKVRGDRGAAKAPRTKAAGSKLKPVPEAAVAAVRDTLQGEGRTRDGDAGDAGDAGGTGGAGDTGEAPGPTSEAPAPVSGGGTTFLQARTAHEVLKAQERRIRLAKLKGELVDRARAETLMFRLAREERDAWVTWPARVAALMAAEMTAALGDGIEVETALMQKVLETHVRAQLDGLAEIRTGLG